MKLKILAGLAAILFASHVFAVDDRIVGSKSSDTATNTSPAIDYDKALQSWVYDYENEVEGAKSDFWYANFCLSDGAYNIASYVLKKTSPDRAAVAGVIRTSMRNLLKLANKDTNTAVDKIWQKWHDIPASEKENMGKLQGDGFAFANDLATNCYLALIIQAKAKTTRCEIESEPVSFERVSAVCRQIAGGQKLIGLIK